MASPSTSRPIPTHHETMCMTRKRENRRRGREQRRWGERAWTQSKTCRHHSASAVAEPVLCNPDEFDSRLSYRRPPVLCDRNAREAILDNDEASSDHPGAQTSRSPAGASSFRVASPEESFPVQLPACVKGDAMRRANVNSMPPSALASANAPRPVVLRPTFVRIRRRPSAS